MKDKNKGAKVANIANLAGQAASLIPGKSTESTSNSNPNATPPQGIQDTIFPGNPNDLNMPVGNYSEYGGYLGQGMNYNNGGMFDNGGRLTLVRGGKSITYTSLEQLMSDPAITSGYSPEEIKQMWDDAVANSNPDAVDVGRTEGPMTEEEARNSSLMPNGPTVMPGNDNYTDNSSNSGSDFRFYENPGMTAKAKKENFAVDTKTPLDNIDQDLSIAQTPTNLLANLLPVAYNAYMLSKKPRYYRPGELYEAVNPVTYDYTDAENSAKETNAGLLNNARNAGLGGGSYLTNLLALSTAGNRAIKDITTAEAIANTTARDTANKANALSKTQAKKESLKLNMSTDAAIQEHYKAIAEQFKDYSNKVLADQLAMSYAKMGAKDISKHLKVGYNPFQLNWFNNKQPELDKDGNPIKA